MNTSKLKSYAPAARMDFVGAVTRRAGVLGIRPDRVEEVTEAGDIALIEGQPFPRSAVPLRKKLIERIRRDGFAQVMEAMAYTWFNRFVAIRFMELHGYFDHGFRVLSDPQGGSVPEILQKAEHVALAGLDREEVIQLKLAGNRDEELYRMILLAQCADLNRLMPDVFGTLNEETILLLPDNLLHSDSLIRELVAGSDEADWEQVEVLGWLYQFYISEKKDQVMARKSAVPTEDIPAVTQLFTPHWIVRYLVENSLGRLWLLNRPSSGLREHMPYYIEGEPETDFLKITKPEEIRLCDPAVGSGHMLTYAFDLLYLIYEEEGYAPADIPALILRHNLYGLEICPRAAQLAELALVFKAREKSRRFFQQEHLVRPHIIELRDVRFAENELRDYIHGLGLGDLFNQPTLKLLHQFEEAKNFGSLIQPCLDEKNITFAHRTIESKDLGGQLFLHETHHKVLRVLEQAATLTQRYHVVVANPPYMGGKGMNGIIKQFLQDNYDDYKSDLFAAFIVRSLSLSLANGFLGFMSPFVWMFISSYEALRNRLISQATITTLVQLEYSGFDGATVPICTFALQNKHHQRYRGGYIRLSNFRGSENQGPKTLEAITNPSCGWFFRADATNFRQIPGSPIAYWLSPKLMEAFVNGRALSSCSEPKSGLSTTDNAFFLRFWHEVEFDRIGFGVTEVSETETHECFWFPFNKGGDYRKWWGNNEYVVNWHRNGIAIKEKTKGAAGGRIVSPEYYFKTGIAWSGISSSKPSMRILEGSIFGSGGKALFSENRLLKYLGFLNSDVALNLLQALSPTLNYEAGHIGSLPIIETRGDVSNDSGVKEMISIARADWDNFETSWDFRDQPLLRPELKGVTLEASWQAWDTQSTNAIRRMQELETENNRRFIAAYGLDGELQPEVPEAQITLARAQVRRDLAAFLSYAVGCVMGRYSPDHPGLILANAGDSLAEYLAKVGQPANALTFVPDEDGIIPVLDAEWFDDDIAVRTREFLRATFGEATLNENIQFIEKSITKELRNYFVNDFYKDHLQTYKNRPIYWLFSSGKEKAFQCLVYLHRYHGGTMARMRTEYVIPLQGKIAARIAHLEEDKTHATASSQRKKLQTEQDKLRKQHAELVKFDEQLRHYADQRIAIDLDDGVKVNYAKFGQLVAESKKTCGNKEDD